jgi:CRP-like cAMP-binding protein
VVGACHHLECQTLFPQEFLDNRTPERLTIPHLLPSLQTIGLFLQNHTCFRIPTPSAFVVDWQLQQVFEVLQSKTTIKITHETISQELGTAREVISRMLKEFERKGLLELYRGKILLKDIEKLEGMTY